MKADERAIIERAAEWMAVLDEGGTAEERAAFGRWLRESPRHVEEALALGALHRATNEFDPGRELPLMAAQRVEVVSLHVDAKTRTPAARRWRRHAIAASLVIAAGALGWGVWSSVLSGSREYSTAVGEQRAFDLPDGSIIYLNTDSRLRVRFSATGRDIRLLSGEALFRVAPDAGRPFRVAADEAVIQAVGTQFNVYRRPDRATAIAVIEGKVRVAGQDVSAGEGVRIAADGRMGPVAPVDTAEVTAWRQRRLVFRKDTLADVIAEFNRYSSSIQLAIEEPAVAQRRLSGVFDADDPKSLLQFLGEDGTLAFRRRGSVTLIAQAARK